MSHAADTHHDPAQQRKEYFRVFRYLVALTVLEVVFVKLPMPKLLITLLVVTASCSKAGLVGYYYMHLKQETLWLKLLACLPLLMFGYLAVLGPDSLHRQFSPFTPERARILPAHHGEGHEMTVEQEAGHEAEKELQENTAKRLEAVKSAGSGAPAPQAGAIAPAAGGASGSALHPRVVKAQTISVKGAI